MEYSVIVIGGGPGGYVAAIRAAQLGARVCLIEKRERLGGVCLNEGCIPTKVFVRTASLLQELAEADTLGITGAGAVGVSLDKLQKRKAAVVRQLVGGVASLLRANGVTVVQGEASFVDKNTVRVGEKTVTAGSFIIATGSEAFIPPFIKQVGEPNIITAREALELWQRPENLAVIGGGVIGIEFAYILSAMGTKVSVLEMCDEILPMVDAEIAALARKKLEQQGVSFYLGARVESISRDSVAFEQGGVKKSLAAGQCLMAIGRVPVTEGLNAEGIGIKMDRRAIAVDAQLRTSVPNIYAIGDVNGKSMLAHTASHEGILAAENILRGAEEKMRYDRIPSCIYVKPELASVGLTEQQAREQGQQVQVGRFPLAGNGKALIEGETVGMVKVIADGEHGEILGVHIMAPHATDMIAEAGLAMNLEATLDEVAATVHPHPTVSEALAEAVLAAQGRAIHFFQK